MPLYHGATEIGAIYKGAAEINRVYKGAVLVWEKGGGSGGPGGGTPGQYIVPGDLGGEAIFLNESDTADRQYLTPAGAYVNEAD